MSWDAYITKMMQKLEDGTIAIGDAAICGIDKGEESVWACSPNWKISVEEIKRLTGDRNNFGQCGPCIGGLKCRILRDNLDVENMNCMDLKTATDAEGNSYNVCVGKSKKALVIARGTKEANGGQVASRVFGIVKYLLENNY